MPLRERIGDELAELRLAAEKRLHGEHLRPAAVVSAVVPAHEAVLGLADAGRVARVDDVLHAVEGDVGRDGRLVQLGLVGHGARRRLPGLADADLRRLHGVGQRRVRLDALGDRTARAARELVAAVGARHAGIVGVAAGEEHVVDRDVLVGVRDVHVERDEARIDALLRVRHEGEVVLHARHDRHERRTRRLHAVDGHREPVLAEGVVAVVEAERAERAGRRDVVALLALPRDGEGGLHAHAHGVGRDARARPHEPRRAVRHLHLHVLDGARAALPHRLHGDVDRLA